MSASEEAGTGILNRFGPFPQDLGSGAKAAAGFGSNEGRNTQLWEVASRTSGKVCTCRRIND